jgi:hypothetical protein
VVKITGVDELVARVRRLQEGIRTAARDATGQGGRELLDLTHERVSQEFQSVPSYIYETEVLGKHGGPGKYEPGTIGTFARRAPSIEGTPWEGQAQRYPAGNPLLSGELGTESLEEDGRYRAVVGYPDLDEHRRHIILWTLFGTRKEQPRPYLQIALRDMAERFTELVREAFTRLIQEA